MAVKLDHPWSWRGASLAVAAGVLVLWLLLAGETSVASAAAGIVVALAAGAWAGLGDL